MKKVIIIGAGPAGLTAANELLKSDDYEVIILEETNFIGGISKTIRYNGNRMDLGGHRFFSKDKRIMKYWKDILPLQGKEAFDDKKLSRVKKLDENGPDPEISDKVMLIRNRISRIYYLKQFFDYPISLTFQTLKNLGFCATIKIFFSYLKSMFFKREEKSLEDFYINRFGNELYNTFFKEYTEKLWGRSPNNISAEWGAQRVKGLSISTLLKNWNKKNKNKETSLIEEFWYPKYGPGQLWETLANNIVEKGGTILTEYKIININVKDNKVYSVLCENNGIKNEFKADIFLSSMPLKDLVCGMTSEEVPDEIKNIANGLPYVDFQTVGVLVKKLKIKNKTKIKTLSNIIPDCWIYVQEPNIKMLRLQIFNNWSPYMVSNPEESVWMGLEYTGLENDEYWNMSDDEFIQFAIKELEQIGIIDQNDVLDSHREKVKKAYPAYFDTYSEIDKIIEFINEFDNLYCIGRNGQHRYNNMDHSMLTAIIAVDNIKNNIKDKSNIWNVNTEKSYHEEQKK